MPKILFVIARLNTGGTSKYLAELFRGLRNSEFEVIIATGYVQGAEIESSEVKKLPIIRIKHLGRRISPYHDLLASFELLKVIKTYKPDLIYSHTFKAGLLVRTLPTRIPMIHAFHGHLLDEPDLAGIRVKVAMILERILAKRSKYLVTVGKKVADELIEAGVGSEEQFISIPPGVIPLKLADKNASKARLGLGDAKGPVVVWMARVVSVKAPERAVSLALRFPDTLFLVVGGGELFSTISSIAPKNMKVIGWQEPEQVWAVADIAISTSINEGMPIALIEAQQSGVPVIALNVGSVSEIVDCGKTGYIFDEFGTDYFNCLKDLIHNESKRIALGNQALQSARAKFSTEMLTDRHLQLFRRSI